MSTGLEIVEIGARTPVGLQAETSAAAVRAGIMRMSECPLAAVDPDGEPKLVAADPRLGFTLMGVERLGPLVHGVIDEVVGKLGRSCSGAPLDVMLVLPEARPGMSELAIEALVRRLATELGASLRARGAHATVTVGGRGNAGVAAAIERVAQSGARRDERLALVVGVDSFHHPDTLLWLEHARHFGPESRAPIVPGEAAGCLALASTRLRKRLALPLLAKIAGVGTALEPCPPDSETGSFGMGMTRAIQGALAGSPLPAAAVDTTYSDINGERYRSEEWAFVALRLPAAFRTLEYEAPATSWGDVGAASGALGGVLAVRSWARGYARGPRALVIGGSRSGARGAILIHHPEMGPKADPKEP
jgi:3-oxoacyl-[acyl-carrier-protein] synthase-1